MAKVVNVIGAEKPINNLLKVCAYARVSVDNDAMMHSLFQQVEHYHKLITSNRKWKYVGVYADEGISGTLEARPEFNKMIEDARAGKIDLIITKSISRFARNTETVLKTIRELNELGVDVYFEAQKIHTLSSDGEFMLTVLSSYYQEEARSISENIKWRIKKNYQKGEMMGYSDSYGYKVIDKKYYIVPEQAEIVRLIFDLYVGGKGIQAITMYLNENGIKPLRADEWTKNTINQIIKNVNYTGDLLLQKSFTKDYISKKKMINKGELAMYLVEDHHEAIISKEIFNKAQEISRQRRKDYGIKVGCKCKHYPFTHKIKCGCCGSYFHHKTTKYTTKWVCNKGDKYGKKYCPSFKAIPDDMLRLALKEYLQIDVLTDELINEKIELIVALPNNLIEVHFIDGSVANITWQDKSRKDSWSLERKAKAREKTLELIRQKGGSLNGKCKSNTIND